MRTTGILIEVRGECATAVRTEFVKIRLQAARSLPSTLLHNSTLGLPARLLLAPLDLPHGRIDRVLCRLGLSVMPRWESVFQRTFEMLEPGGRYAAMDLYIEPGRG